MRGGGLEGARGFGGIGVLMVGLVRRAPVDKCEISELFGECECETGLGKNTGGCRGDMKAIKIILWWAYDSGGSHRARWFQVEAFQVEIRREKVKVSREGIEQIKLLESSVCRAGEIWKAWEV